MKSLISAPILLATMAAAAAIEPRQANLNSMLGSVIGRLPGAEGIVTTAKAQIRSDAKRIVIKYGPFALAANKDVETPKMEGGHAHGGAMGATPPPPKKESGDPAGPLATFSEGGKPMDPNGIGIVKRLASGMCKNCTVLTGKTTVVYANGTKADLSNGVYLHHAVAIDVSKPTTPFVTGCPSVAGSLAPFLGGAVDGFTQFYTTHDGKFPSGYYIKDNSFLMQAEVVNYRREPQDVYIQIDMEYMEGQYGSDAQQSTLAATDCSSATQSFKPPKNTVGELKSQPYPVTKDGTIIISRGHMHDGGTSVTMLVNDKPVCVSKATYGGSSSLVIDGKEWQSITAMGECSEPIPVKKGDILRVLAGYDTKNHPLRESHGEEQENMGIMTFVFVAK